MNREVHVRFWESPEVKVLRASRHVWTAPDWQELSSRLQQWA